MTHHLKTCQAYNKPSFLYGETEYFENGKSLWQWPILGLVDEEGMLKNKEVNAYASQMYATEYGDENIITGNAEFYIPNTLTKSQWFS